MAQTIASPRLDAEVLLQHWNTQTTELGTISSVAVTVRAIYSQNLNSRHHRGLEEQRCVSLATIGQIV